MFWFGAFALGASPKVISGTAFRFRLNRHTSTPMMMIKRATKQDKTTIITSIEFPSSVKTPAKVNE